MKNKTFNIRYDILVILFLVIVTAAVYWQVKDHDFVNYDDNQYITENPHVQAGLTFKGVVWALTTHHTGYWHPLTWFSHMLDVELYGLKPGGHHITNVIFHIINTLLLFLVLYRMTKAIWQSAFVAAVFALHPLHVESVAWVAERKDVLSAFFWMLTMGAYVYYVERPGFQRYLIVLAFFVLGLMSKPMVVTLPFVLLLLDLWPLNRFHSARSGPDIRSDVQMDIHTSLKKQKSQKKAVPNASAKKSPRFFLRWVSIRPLIMEKLPFLSLSLVSGMVTMYGTRQAGTLSSFQAMPLNVRIENALTSYVHYIGKMVWFKNLAVFYPLPGMLPVWQVLAAVLLLLAITLFVIWMARQYPYLIVGWLWYLGTMIPVIGIVQVGAQSMADRYTYVPMIGILIMLAWGLPEFVKRWPYHKAALGILTGLIISILMMGTWIQVRYWQNSITLFKHTLDITSNNYIAHSNLGHSLLLQGKIEEAIYHYSESLRIYPNGDEEHNNIGMALQEQGRFQEAVNHYNEAIRINPNYIKAYINLGGAFAGQGKFSDAMKLYSEALRIKPDSAEIHYNLGTLLAYQGKIEEAIIHFRETARIKPDHAKAYNNLGSALLLRGKVDDAVDSFRQALRLVPDDKIAQENLKNALILQKKSR